MKKMVGAFVLLLLGVAFVAQAATTNNVWTPTNGGSLSDAANWNQKRVPLFDDMLQFRNLNTAPLTMTNNVSAYGMNSSPHRIPICSN